MQSTKLLFGLVLAAPALAQQLQTRPEVLQLSLKQAVEMALAPEGSTRVKLAEEALKQARSQADEARAGLLPDFESYAQYQNETNNLKAFGFNFANFSKVPIPGFSIPTFVGPFGVFDVRASVSQTVFDFSTIRRYQASKVAIEAVKADNEGTRNQVTDQVARAYLAGLRAQATLDTAHANVDLSKRCCGSRRRKSKPAPARASRLRAPKFSWPTTASSFWWLRMTWIAHTCSSSK